MISWLEDREQEGEISLDFPVLDVGCGNGVMCVDLVKAGFTNLTGKFWSLKKLNNCFLQGFYVVLKGYFQMYYLYTMLHHNLCSVQTEYFFAILSAQNMDCCGFKYNQIVGSIRSES